MAAAPELLGLPRVVSPLPWPPTACRDSPCPAVPAHTTIPILSLTRQPSCEPPSFEPPSSEPAPSHSRHPPFRPLATIDCATPAIRTIEPLSRNTVEGAARALALSPVTSLASPSLLKAQAVLFAGITRGATRGRAFQSADNQPILRSNSPPR